MPPFKGHQRLVSSPALYQPPMFLARPTPTASPMSNPAAGAPAGSSALAGHRASFQPITYISSLVALLLGQSALALRWAFHVSPTLRQYTPGLLPSAWGQKAATISPEIWLVTVGTLHLSLKLSPGYLRSNVLQSAGFPSPCLPCWPVSQELPGLPAPLGPIRPTPHMFH